MDTVIEKVKSLVNPFSCHFLKLWVRCELEAMVKAGTVLPMN